MQSWRTGSFPLHNSYIIIYYLNPSFSHIGVMAIILMLCALPFLTGKGYYMFQTFDDWSGSLPLVVIALFQCIAVAWVYGNDKYVQ